MIGKRSAFIHFISQYLPSTSRFIAMFRLWARIISAHAAPLVPCGQIPALEGFREEFAALGVLFEERGRRLDEDRDHAGGPVGRPVTFRSRYISSVIDGMTMTPMPVSPIPIWFGGSAEPALKRTIRIGWKGSGLTAGQAAPNVNRGCSRHGQGRIYDLDEDAVPCDRSQCVRR
jgi:hypothetical protein